MFAMEPFPPQVLTLFFYLQSFELDHCFQFLLHASISRSAMVFHHVRLTIALAPLIKRPARYSQHSRHFFHRPRSSILKLFHGRSSKLLAPLLTHFLFLLSRPTFPLLLHATSILTLGGGIAWEDTGPTSCWMAPGTSMTPMFVPFPRGRV